MAAARYFESPHLPSIEAFSLQCRAEEENSLLPLHHLTFDSLSDEAYEEAQSEKPTASLELLLESYIGYWRRILLNLATFLLPSFISYRLSGNFNTPKSHPLRPSAYLDGLRGIAAWSVINTHLTTTLCRTCGAGFGHPGDHYQVYKLPGIRLIYSGEFSVALFFVISGYVLSISPIKAMGSNRDPAGYIYKIASAIVKRPIRLYVPALVSMFFNFMLIRFGYLTWYSSHLGDYASLITGWQPLLDNKPERFEYLSEQLFDLLKCIGDLFRIFESSYDKSYKLPYNGVLWTIKLELRASLVLYLAYIALYHVSPLKRKIILSSFIIGGWAINSFDMPLFFAGYLLAELDMISPPEAKSLAKSAIWWALFLIGLFIGSYPEWEAEQTPSYHWLWKLTPFEFMQPSRMWTGLGAIITVAAISNINILKIMCSIRPIHYLGKISFSLYLVHFYIVQGIGEVVFYNIWSFTGKINPLALMFGFLLSYIIIFLVLVLLADVFWRAVDQPSVRLGTEFQDWLFKETK